MPEQTKDTAVPSIMSTFSSTVDDLNLDFSDRKWEERPVNAARFPVEFKLHDTDSECSGNNSDADGEEEDEDTDDEYFFDHRLDFGHYIPKTNTVTELNTTTQNHVTDSESGGCHGDRTGDLDRTGGLDLGRVGGKVVGNVPSGVTDKSNTNSTTGTSTGHVKPSQEEALVNGNLNMCNNTVTRSNDLDLEQKRKSAGQQNGLDDAMRTNVIREKDENRNDVKVMEIVNGVRAGLDIQRITELNGVKLDTLTSAVEKFSLAARRNDREEIRKKLAMGGEEDSYDDNDIDDDDDDDDVGYKKASLQSRLHSGLQICFMNESPGDTDNEGVSPRQHEIHDNSKLTLKHDSRVDSDNNLSTMEDLNNPGTLAGTSIQTTSPPRLKTDEQSNIATSEGNFQTRQEQLQNEAKLALAQAGSMAHMQLEIEKQTKKKSPMAEMAGIPGLGERRRKKLSPRQLQQMNLAQTQVLYNDLQTQIESLNEELVHLLMERDELHMEQDSMLVDIEDLTRRAEELADKANRDSRTKTCNAKGKLPSR